MAQENSNISWKFSPSNNKDSLYINISADIKDQWYLYGENIGEGGPLPLLIEIENTDNIIESQKLISKTKTDLKYDDVFNMNVESYKNKADFQLIYNTKTKNDYITIFIDGQICNSKDGKCEAIYEKYKIKTN